MSKPKTKAQRADYVPVQTGVRWDDDDRAIIRNLKRIFRKEGRGKMVDVLRAAIRELAARYDCLPKRLQGPQQ
jgi:hypothetical protein